MSEDTEPEVVEPTDDTDGVPLCTGCGRPYARDQYYCQYCGAGVGNRTPYVPYVNISFNYRPVGQAVRNLWRGEERRWWGVLFSLILFVACLPYLVLAAPFLLAGWLRNRKKQKQGGPSETPPDDGRDAPG